MDTIIKPHLPTGGLLQYGTDRSADYDNWGFGWTIVGHCPVGGVEPCDATGTPRTLPSAPTPVTFPEWDAWQAAGCLNGTSRTLANIQDVVDAVNTTLEVNTEGWLATGLEYGVKDTAISLRGICTDITPGTLTDVNVAIGLLIRRRHRAGIFDRPLIHLPAWTAQLINNSTYVLNVADLVFSPGYGLKVYTGAGGDVNTYAYITGPVEYAIKDFSADHVRDLRQERRNFTNEMQTKLFAARFDPCGTFSTAFKVY